MKTSITLTNREITPAVNALSTLGELPAGPASLKIVRLIVALLPEARLIEAQRRALIAEFADRLTTKEFMARDAALLDATTTFELELLTVVEAEDLPKRASLNPANLAVVFMTFTEKT